MSNCDYCHKPLRKSFVTGFGFGGAVRFYHKVCAVRKDQVECEDCGKLFDYHDGHSTREWDTGATSWYCPECSGQFYEPEGMLWDYEAEEAYAAQMSAYDRMMREGA